MNGFATVIASGFLAAIVSGLVSFLTSERRLASENIIQERTKWRERVRCLADEAHSAILRGETDTNKFRELRAKFALRLNLTMHPIRKSKRQLGRAAQPTRMSLISESRCYSNTIGNAQGGKGTCGFCCSQYLLSA